MPNLQGSEAAFQEQVLKLARVCGWLMHHDRPALDRRGHWATHVQGDPGFPDLVLVKRGRILFWELKVGHGKLTPAQQEWAEALLKVAEGEHGLGSKAMFMVITPADWDFIERVLKEV